MFLAISDDSTPGFVVRTRTSTTDIKKRIRAVRVALTCLRQRPHMGMTRTDACNLRAGEVVAQTLYGTMMRFKHSGTEL